jgi:nucleotide-binding universal stress UspA family protein
MDGRGETKKPAVHPFRRLLVPLDGSPMAEAVAPSAARLAREAGASVMLLHLIERHAPAAVHGSPHLTRDEEAEAYLAHVAETFFAEVPVSWHVHKDGVRDVAHSVSTHADEFDPDLIVMCSHDATGWWRWIWGNMGQRDLSPAFPFRRVLIPLDGDPRHETGVDAGGELARLSAAPVELLQVVPTRTTLAGPSGITRSYMPGVTDALLDLAETQTRQYLAEQMQGLCDRGLRGRASLARGEAFEEIVAHIDRVKPDLLVLATHGKIGTEAFWAGSLSQRLLDRCSTTFLLAPAQT